MVVFTVVFERIVNFIIYLTITGMFLKQGINLERYSANNWSHNPSGR